MQQRITPLIYSSVIFIVVCILVTIAITHFSLIHFVGPVAGIASAIALVWGVIALLIVLSSTLFLILAINGYGNFDLNIAIIILIYSGALLQAIWAKQLTYSLIYKQKWVESRQSLFSFMLIIGPVVAITSALCGSVVAIVDNETFNVSLSYVLVRTWSASVLVSVFVIPSLLLIQGEQKLSISKRSFAVVSSLLSCVAIALLFQISKQQQQHNRLDLYQQARYEINDTLEKEKNTIQAELRAMGAFFNNSKEVNFDEFKRFAKEIYQSSSISSFQWSPVVKVTHKKYFEQYAKSKLGFDYTIQSVGDEKLINQNDFTPFIPVLYLYPLTNNEHYFGLDLYAYSAISPALRQALQQQRILASAPFSMQNNNESSPLVIVSQTVNRNHEKDLFGELMLRSGEKSSGFLHGIVDLNRLVEKLMMHVLKKNISMTIIDITDGGYYLIYGDKLMKKNRLQNSSTISFFGRQWKIDIAENAAWITQNKSWQAWFMLIGGVVGGFTFQLLILMMASYSIELSHKVAEKTRELIKANELSEQEHQSKAQFLQTLTRELSTPIMLAERLTDKQLSSNKLDKTVQFKEVTDQLKHILMSVSELSTIESLDNTAKNYIFDFSDFLQHIDHSFQKNALGSKTSVKFLFDSELPSFVDADPKRLEKLLLSLQENLLTLFTYSDVQVSVKAHYHLEYATLFFTCSALSAHDDMVIHSWLKKDIANFSTSMALVTELIQVLKGNIKLTVVSSSDVFMTISMPIKVNLSQNESNHIDEINIQHEDQKIHVLVIEESFSTNFEITPLLLELDCTVETINHQSELPQISNLQYYDLIIIDNITLKPYVAELEHILDALEGVNVVGIYRGIEYRQLPDAFKQKMSEFILYPIVKENLQAVLDKTQVNKDS
ncbi:MAG: CHASE domain-containing protein [Thalassotalea sp.]